MMRSAGNGGSLNLAGTCYRKKGVSVHLNTNWSKVYLTWKNCQKFRRWQFVYKSKFSRGVKGVMKFFKFRKMTLIAKVNVFGVININYKHFKWPFERNDIATMKWNKVGNKITVLCIWYIIVWLVELSLSVVLYHTCASKFEQISWHEVWKFYFPKIFTTIHASCIATSKSQVAVEKYHFLTVMLILVKEMFWSQWSASAMPSL